MKRKQFFLIPIIISIAVVFGFALGYWVEGTVYGKQDQPDLSNIASPESMDVEDLVSGGRIGMSGLGQVLNYIDKYYVEEIGIDTLTKEFIPEVMAKLDPHSAYIPAEDVLKANENLQGSFDGVGIMFNMVTDTLVVLEVISGGPSSKVGLEMGDKIIKIDSINVAGVKYDQNEVVKLLRGEGGTKVVVSVDRDGFPELIDFSIIRGKVAIESLETAIMLKPTVGYIKLLRFAKTTHSEVSEAIDSLTNLGMKSLIFDLTSNSGGYLDQAILIANEFLPKESLIVYTEGKNGEMFAKQYSDGNGRFTKQDLFVLVNEFSASSSEIVAGAIQDNDRGVIVGRRTFGKGLVQQQIPLIDGSMIHLTIAKYHTPSGRCIQKPYEMGNSEEYNKDLINRFDKMEFVNADSINQGDSVKYYTKLGRVVYGGGGIFPDNFVALDTTALAPFMTKALSSLHLIKFVTYYATSHSKQLQALTSIDKVNKYLDKNIDTIYKDYVKFLRTNKVKISNKNVEKFKEEIIPYIKAYVGQYTSVGADAFYYIMYPLNDITRTAVELAENPNKINI